MLEHNKNDMNKSHIGNKIDHIAKIVVIGVGGGGNNTVNSMIQEGVEGIKFICANTDEQVLKQFPPDMILSLGKNNAKGLGAGANPEVGKQAATESEKEIHDLLKDADMVIISAGMGGGTGTGGAPVIARIAKEIGALTIGVVTTPFVFEGTQRSQNAQLGLKEMKENTDSLIVVSNNKLLEQFGGISLKDSFLYADKIMKQTVRTITDLIAVPALINLDFADVKSIMKDKGMALIGIGRASGDQDRAIKAAVHAISSPILEASIEGATDAIINISGGDITLDDANKAVDTIQKASGSNLNIIFGVSINERLGKDIYVSVIATGLENTQVIQDTDSRKDEISKTISTIELDFESESSREDLVNDPLPEVDKMSVSDEYEFSNSKEEDENTEDDEDDLPAFLRG